MRAKACKNNSGLPEFQFIFLDTESSLQYDNLLHFFRLLFSAFALPQGAASQTDLFFEGCVRNFKLNDDLVDWHKTYSLIDVHVSACPISIYPTKP